MVAKMIRTHDRSENIDLSYLQNRASEHNKYQMKWVILFLSTLNFNF